MMQTSYDVLGVPRNASDEAIRAAFRKAAKACHPDLNAGDPTREQELRQVLAAYELLRNPQQRAVYDQSLDAYERYLRNSRRKKIQRLAAAPVAALVSSAVVALGVTLWSGPPQASGSAAGKVAQHASQQVAVADEIDSPRPAENPAKNHAVPQTPVAREWEQVGASGDAMAIWRFAIRNPDAPQAELAHSKLVELIDTAENVFVLNVLRAGAADAIAERAQQRLTRLGAMAVGEGSRAPSSDALEERALSFISAQISAWSSASATELPSFANAYADRVLYYGSLKSRQAVLVDKRHLLERWPERLYEMQPDSVTVQCTADVCKVNGLIDWQTRSPRRAASASGIARFEYQLALAGAAFNIIGESSAVVRPQRTGF
jgi:curved DNA-binding protein CbpA